jgi:hypothetical protein
VRSQAEGVHIEEDGGVRATVVGQGEVGVGGAVLGGDLDHRHPGSLLRRFGQL